VANLATVSDAVLGNSDSSPSDPQISKRRIDGWQTSRTIGPCLACSDYSLQVLWPEYADLFRLLSILWPTARYDGTAS